MRSTKRRLSRYSSSLFPGEAGDHVGPDSCFRDPAPNLLHQAGKAISRIGPKHSLESPVTTTLQADVEVGGDPPLALFDDSQDPSGQFHGFNRAQPDPLQMFDLKQFLEQPVEAERRI